MRAVRYEAFGGPVELCELPEPVPEPTGAVIEVGATGLCRSDWHGWRGHDPDVRLPQVPGHELAGVVVEVGEAVDPAWVGRRVTVPFVCACGTCRPCREGDMQVCDNQFQPGFTHQGSFAERVAVGHAAVNLVALPDEVDIVSAAALGCRFSTAYRAVRGQGRPRPGDWVAVHGCGGVGLSAVQVARAGGARVVAVDVSARALAMAASFGAETCIDPGAVADVAEAVRSATDGGAHVSLDALGSPATCVSSVRSLRKRGRHVQVGLLPPAEGRPELPMELVVGRELEILGSHGMAAHAYPALLAEIASGALRPDLLVTRRIGLDQAGPALETMVSAPVAGVTVVTRLRAGETDPHDRDSR